MGATAPSRKYAHAEREQRFLLANVPVHLIPVPARAIQYRYLRRTQVRLRVIVEPGREPALKLSRKVRMSGQRPLAVARTIRYLNRPDYHTFSVIPADRIHKYRWLERIRGNRRRRRPRPCRWLSDCGRQGSETLRRRGSTHPPEHASSLADP
jgi:hypothetical protein